MTHPTLHTPLCDLFGTEYPIVQTGMGWVAGASLASATSKAGGLGIIAGATMTFEQLRDAIHTVKDRTGNPFGVNMRPDQPDLDDRVAMIVREGVKVASFAQPPRKETVQRLHDGGLVVMPTIGARRHAEKVAELGVDAVIAQGGEGGGHTGSVPTSLLLPQVVDVFPGPVVGAGGFHDGRGLVAALAYGCTGIAMGTRFLLTQESRVPDEIKAIYLKTPVTGTVVSKHIDGHPQRVIRTDFVDHLEGSGRLTALPRAAKNALEFRKLTGTSMLALLKEGLAMRREQGLPWSQVVLAANAPMLTKASMVDGHAEAGILPTGQVVGLVDELPTVHDLVQRIMDDAEQTLKRLGA
ncbi:MAG TPA: nitronate monooxygenase family protein [Acidimicrobiia bacterium]|nr:nitronate monooxygenase family protein [Acidimicrobiia bacterium]